jgi:hypothetical protein
MLPAGNTAGAYFLIIRNDSEHTRPVSLIKIRYPLMPVAAYSSKKC